MIMNAVGWLMQQVQGTGRLPNRQPLGSLRVPAPVRCTAVTPTRAGTTTRRGFSLVELMVTITIGAILMAAAVPGFIAMVSNNRLQTQSSNLVLSLNLARSESIKQDLAGGVAVIAAGGVWTNGWSVCCAAGTATALQSQGAVGNNLTVKAVNPAGALGTITFDSNGALLAGAGTVMFTFCDSRGSSVAREVEVDMAGRIQTAAKPGYRADQTTALVCP